MFVAKAVVLCILLAVVWSAQGLTFPPGFKFGSATASYQVEGAWNVSDKGENIWDRYTHDNPDKVRGGVNGDVACDSYNQWQRDIEMATELGLHFYRFSLSWTRILPSGFSNYISEDGIRFYNNMIDGLMEKGIEPLVTLYHWDLPQTLQDLGGWTNPLVVDWFGDYARVVYTLFGDRVKIWLTINEPIIVCDAAYSSGAIAPGIKDPKVGMYLCNKHILLAHAKAWRIYDEEFRPKYQGEVSLANRLLWIYPNGEENEDLAALARDDTIGRYSHPIFSKEGGWPSYIEKAIAENSKKEGYSKSRLPEFSLEEIEFIRGTYDFYAMNHYTSRLARKMEDGDESSIFGGCPELNIILEAHPDWETTESNWFFVGITIHPEGIRRLLIWLKEQYGDIKFMITENGLATGSGLDDQKRIQYYRDYLKQVLLAIKEDGVNVTHYTAWTLMDNFEWTDGYSSKFGLYEVDFSDPKRTRTPRASAKFYADIIKNQALESRSSEL